MSVVDLEVDLGVLEEGAVHLLARGRSEGAREGRGMRMPVSRRAVAEGSREDREAGGEDKEGGRRV